MNNTSDKDGCQPEDEGMECCRVESIVSVDERGQMVLPKELRAQADIKAGDKLAVASWQRDGKICCICMIKAENLADMVRDMLGPVMAGVYPKKKVK